MTRFVTVLFIFCISYPAFSGKIEKAFDALQKKNFYDAEMTFRKLLKKNTSVASYGLTKLYLTNDYRILDSAYKFVLQSEANFQLISPKSLTKLKSLGFDSLAIQDLKQTVSNAFFEKYLKNPNEEIFIQFIEQNAWSVLVPAAIHLRDSIAFSEAEARKSSIAFTEFLAKYPSSYLAAAANLNFIEYQYLEFARRGRIEDFETFLKCCGESPHKVDAENRLYELCTNRGKIEDYYAFAKKYPENSNYEDAWRMVYKLFLKEYSLERFLAFKEKYPDYPYLNEIEEDLKLFHESFYPFASNDLFGYFDSEGKVVIEPQYDQASAFQDGLAIVGKNEKFGLINKKNQVLIEFLYDEILEFSDARSVVIVGDSFGIIDRSGRAIVPVRFNDILALSNGLFALQFNSESNYVITDINANPKTEAVFEEINVFENGVCIAKTKAGYGIFNKECKWQIPPSFESLKQLSDSLFEFGLNGKKGLIRLDGKKVVEAIYDEFSKYDAVGKQILARQGVLLFHLNEFGQKIIPNPIEFFPGAFENAFFYKGTAIYRYKNKFGLLDNTFREVLKPQFDGLGRVFTGVPIFKNQKWGIIDYNGKLILPLEYDNIETLPNFGYLIEKNGMLGVLDQDFKTLIPTSFSIVKPFETDYFLVSNGKKYGLYSKKGELILPVHYDLIKVFEGDCLSLYTDNETAYYFLRSKLYLK
ncbi:MAG: WG repeat-containing protein [Flavobacteriales bacterium]|nr:WG repeat-containing protein [Flavobacteriales bacterium]